MNLVRLMPLISFRRDTRASSALEFSFICIPLFAFLFGIMEFGRAVWIEEALQSTASKVSRCVGLKLTQRQPIAGAPNYETSVCPYASNPPNGVTSLYPQGSLVLCGCNDSSGLSSAKVTAYATNLAQNWGLSITAANITASASTSCPGMSASTGYASVTMSYPLSSTVTSLLPSLANKTLSAQACFPMSS